MDCATFEVQSKASFKLKVTQGFFLEYSSVRIDLYQTGWSTVAGNILSEWERTVKYSPACHTCVERLEHSALLYSSANVLPFKWTSFGETFVCRGLRWCAQYTVHNYSCLMFPSLPCQVNFSLNLMALKRRGFSELLHGILLNHICTCVAGLRAH